MFSAVALKGLVEALTAAGCVLVGSSNRAPQHLPRHGLHEAMWGHFVDTWVRMRVWGRGSGVGVGGGLGVGHWGYGF